MENIKRLLESSQYTKKFRGKIFVVKLGGAAMNDAEAKRAVAEDIALLSNAGMRIVLVHGAGPEITKRMKEAGLEPKFIGGLRVTDEKTIAIVEEGYLKMNEELASLVQDFGAQAEKIIGSNGLITARQMDESLGLVGKIEKVDAGKIMSILEKNKVPVIAPLGGGEQGTYNINADIAAGDIAKALGAEKFILLTDVKGVYRNFEKKEGFLSTLTLDEAKKLKEGVSSGMIPKLDACINALEGGVKSAHIIEGENHNLIYEILTSEGCGTMITP